MIIYAVDASKSASELIGFQASLVRESARLCSGRHEGFGLIVYAARAAPLVDFTRNPDTLFRSLSNPVIMRGTPEPTKAVKEAVDILFGMRRGVPSIGDLVVLLWSMPKKPRIPVSYAKIMVSSIGADLKIVGLQYSPPKWFRTSRYDVGVEIIYRRRTRETDLARRLGCGEI